MVSFFTSTGIEFFAEIIVSNNLFLKKSQVLITPDDIKIAKPDPEGILRGCKDLGIHPTECVYVGDHAKDIEAGINAGTEVIACYFGYSLKIGDCSEHILGANHPNEIYELISKL